MGKLKKYYCSCEQHYIDLDTRPIYNRDYIGLTIYEFVSPKTGKKYKKPIELGTVVLIGKEAIKFKDEIKRR